MKTFIQQSLARFFGVLAAFALAISFTAFADVVHNDEPVEDPAECDPRTDPTCVCDNPEDGADNGCLLVTLGLGNTTPWTGSTPVRLKIYTGQANPSISTPSQLKLVLGYTFKNLGSDRTSAGAPATVDFAQSKGLLMRFRFPEGSSVGAPLATLRADDDVRLQMVDAEGWATLSSPAYYDLYPGDGSVWRFIADPSLGQLGDLVRTADSRGVVRTPDDMGVTVHRDAAGFLRQVCTPSRLADVQVVDDRHYIVTVYPLASEPDTDSETGLFVPPSNPPTRVLDVRRGATDQELFVGLRKGTGDMRTFRYVAQNGDWTLFRPSGLRDAKELYYNDDGTGARRLHLVWDANGTLLRRTEQNYSDSLSGWALTNKVKGLDGELRDVATWSYYTDGPNKGKVAEKVEPNGNRILFEYDALNRIVRQTLPLVEEETLYSYTPVDPSDPVLLRDLRPRCVVKKVQNVEVERTYYVYGTNGVDVVERVGEPGADYGGTNVLRTVTTYYPVTGSVSDGLVQSVRHEDGTVDNYAYDLTDGVWTETVTLVHEQAPDIVPMRTTRFVRVYNALGQLVDSRTDLCTIGVEDLVPQADWTPIERLQYAYDIDGNEIRREDLAGRLWTAEWAGNCCGKVSETDWQGITTTYAYDAEGRVIAKQTGSILTETAYDAFGRATNVVRTGIATADRPAATIHPASFKYDSLGRLMMDEGEDGIRRVYAYAYRPEGGETRTDTEAPGTDCERVTTTVSDSIGRTIHELRNGVLLRSVVYTPLLKTVYEGPKGTNSPVWRETRFDRFGRVVETHQPGFGGAILHSCSRFDDFGCPVETKEGYTSGPLGAELVVTSRRLSAFDTFGDLVLSAEDVNSNSLIDLAGPDVIVSNALVYVVRDESLWREFSRYTFPDTASAEPLLVSMSRIRLTDLDTTETTELGEASIIADAQTVDACGNISTQRSFINRSLRQVLTVKDSAFSAISAWNLSIDGFAISNRTAIGVLLSRDYDALGRVIAQTDGRGIVSSYSYDDSGRLASTTDATGAVTAYGYDALGRRTSVTNALGLVTTTAYDLDGNVVSQRGAQYPVDYTYDAYGRMAAMSTYRSEDLSHADVTTWLYDEATGLMTNKVYADGKGPTYDYTPDGHLSRRTWARGVITDYAYDSQGRLVSKTYSDATPNVSLVYDRLGHTISAVCAGVSTNFYAYNRLGQLTNEVQNGTTIARSYDALGRATGYVVGDGIAAGSSVSYAYDTLGRFASVSSGTNVFSYSYLPGSDLVSGMAANTGHAWERIYEPDRDLIATVHNRYGNRTISRFDYTNDEIGRRIARVDSGEAFSETTFERYAYNGRSEVISSQRYFGTNLNDQTRPVPNCSFGYSYDPIGNRIISTEEQENLAVVTHYESNQLNQYIQTTNKLSVTNYEYDDDGNMIFDGSAFYEWNGENQMCSVIPMNPVLPEDELSEVHFFYDEIGRMIAVTLETNRLLRVVLWDSMNIIYEKIGNDASFNVWGLDANGVFQGLGGIGGLLATYSSCIVYISFYDANGNIVDYLDGDANSVAHYEYSLYGAIDNSRGPLANRFSHKFSTKPANPITGLTEFEFRCYNPNYGVWLSFDPAFEPLNTPDYRFANNSPLNYIDLYGLKTGKCCAEWTARYNLLYGADNWVTSPKGTTYNETYLRCLEDRLATTNPALYSLLKTVLVGAGGLIAENLAKLLGGEKIFNRTVTILTFIQIARIMNEIGNAAEWCSARKCTKFVPKIWVKHQRSRFNPRRWFGNDYYLECECPPGTDLVFPDKNGEVWK